MASTAPPAAIAVPSGSRTRPHAESLSMHPTPGRTYLVIAAAALVLGALSLLVPSTPSYDPWAWLVWGHEIIHLDLHTSGGPSWKPLPMIFTTVFAVFGKAQPDLWLVVARAGAVMAVAMVFKVAWRVTRQIAGHAPAGPAATSGAIPWLVRLGPLLAGVIAAGSLINSPGFISDNALGYSEGLATALMLIAVDRYLDGQPRQAFAVGFLAALDRPELWIFWGPYGLYLFWRDAGARRLVIGLFALIPVLWFLPELWGSGHLFRGVTRAQHPRSNSAAFSSCPICTVFKKEAWPTVLNRVKVAGIVAMVAAAVTLARVHGEWWPLGQGRVSEVVRARTWLLIIGLFGLVWWVGIAVETQAHFSGNTRYLVLGSAPVAIAGGIAWGWLAQAVPQALGWLSTRAAALRRLAVPSLGLPAGAVVAVGLFLAVPPWISKNIISLPRTHGALVYQADLRQDLGRAVAALGGRQRILSCGSVMAEGFQVPMVAWTLGVRTLRVEAPPTELVGKPWPNVIFQTRDTRHAALLPLPEQIVAWEHAGARYKMLHIRSLWAFTTCPTKAS